MITSTKSKILVSKIRFNLRYYCFEKNTKIQLPLFPVPFTISDTSTEMHPQSEKQQLVEAVTETDHNNKIELDNEKRTKASDKGEQRSVNIIQCLQYMSTIRYSQKKLFTYFFRLTSECNCIQNKYSFDSADFPQVYGCLRSRSRNYGTEGCAA